MHEDLKQWSCAARYAMQGASETKAAPRPPFSPITAPRGGFWQGALSSFSATGSFFRTGSGQERMSVCLSVCLASTAAVDRDLGVCGPGRGTATA